MSYERPCDACDVLTRVDCLEHAAPDVWPISRVCPACADAMIADERSTVRPVERRAVPTVKRSTCLLSYPPTVRAVERPTAETSDRCTGPDNDNDDDEPGRECPCGSFCADCTPGAERWI